MKDSEDVFFKKLESFKNNFDNSLKIIENKLAEKLTDQSKFDKLNNDLNEMKSYINDTERSLEELKSIFK